MKLAKRTLVLLLTLAMLIGCIPAFAVTAKEAVIEGVESTSDNTSYEQIYVKNGLVLLSTVYGNEGDGNIDFSTGVWNNRVGDENIAIVGQSKAATGTYNGWWIGENGKGVGYNLYDKNDWNGKKRLYGMRLPLSLLGDHDIAVEYVFDYIGLAYHNMTNTTTTSSDKDSGHGAFTFQGLFLTFYQPSVAAADSYGKTGMDMVFHYANVGLEYNPGKASPINGGVSDTVTDKLLSAEDNPETDINVSLVYAKDGAFTMTINRDYATGGPNLIGGRTTHTQATTYI